MAKQKIIRLSKSKMIFPAKFTRVMSHDLINISVNKQKYLTSGEQRALQNIGENTDFLVMRKGKILTIVPF